MMIKISNGEACDRWIILQIRSEFTKELNNFEAVEANKKVVIAMEDFLRNAWKEMDPDDQTAILEKCDELKTICIALFQSAKIIKNHYDGVFVMYDMDLLARYREMRELKRDRRTIIAAITDISDEPVDYGDTYLD